MNKIITLSLLLMSCTSSQIVKTPDGMKVATESMVKDCEFKSDVHGVSSLYGAFVEKGLANAREKAFNQAKQLGANTIVWIPIKTGYGSTEVSGDAYFCK